MSETLLSEAIITTDNIEASDFLLIQKSAGGDILRARQKEIDAINQVPKINFTSQTTEELDFLNGINANYVIDLRNSTQSAVSFTFSNPLNADKKTARRIYFRVIPHATNDINVSFPNASPFFTKFISPFSSTKTVPAGTGGASEIHWEMVLEGGWSIGRIAQLT